MKTNIYKIFGLLLLALFSLPIMFYVHETYQINGSDIYGHLYKTDVVYKNIQDGNFFVLYDEKWYNGIQMFRYWPPLSYYFLAFLQFICGGVIENAYVLFVGVTYVMAGFAWVLFGAKTDHKWLGLIIGLSYWFFPDNLKIFFGEGNVPRIMFTVLVPYMVYFAWCFLHYKKQAYMFAVVMLSIIMVATHLMMSAIVGISMFLFCFIYFLVTKEFTRPLQLLCGIVFGYLSCGIVLVPGLIGGLTGQSSSASINTIEDWLQDLPTSINPIARFENNSIFYFGLSLFIIAILFLRKGFVKRNPLLYPPLISALLIYLSTSSSLSTVIKVLPMSQVWWMERFVIMASAFIAMSFFLMKKEDIKKLEYSLLISLLIIDVFPSLFMIGKINANSSMDKTYAEINESHLYDEAMTLTNNRLLIVDEALFGSYESFFFKDTNVNTGNGWALQGSQTYSNIVHINEAIQTKSYSYAWDRILNLGADSVVFYKRLIDSSELIDFKTIGEAYGFDVISENEICVLFDLKDVDYTFGVVNDYENLAIGSSSHYVSLMYPSFATGKSDYIDDYSVNELKEYKRIYLSGNFYKDKARAELIVAQLDEYGTEITIDMGTIPDDYAGYKTFGPVSARTLTLERSFPNITYHGKEYEINFDMIDDWNAAYLTNAEKLDESFVYANQHYSYMRKKGNVTYLGMNLVYFYNQYPTEGLKYVLDNMFQMVGKTDIVKKQLVPVDIQIDHHMQTVIVNTEYDNVNTTLSYQDFFDSLSEIKKYDNMLVVDEGTTEISFSYKYFRLGVMVSIIGFICTTLLLIEIYTTKGRDSGTKV